MNRLNFNEEFKSSLTLSELMVGKDKIDTEDIIKYYPEGISINAIDLFELNGDEVYVYTFKEAPDKFAFAGYILKNLFEEMVSKYSIETCNEALRETPYTVKLSQGKTKDNKQVTKVQKI